MHTDHLGILFKSFLHLLIFCLLVLLNIERTVLTYVTVLLNWPFFLKFYQFLLHVFGSMLVKLNRYLGLLSPIDELDSFHYEVTFFIPDDNLCSEISFVC